MNRKQFIHILKKYQNGTATRQEKRFIEAYYDLFEAKKEELTDDSILEDDMLNDMWLRLKDKKEKGKVKIKRWQSRSMRMAAAILALVMFGGALWYVAAYYSRYNKTDLSKTTASNLIDSIVPGGNKAVLTLANGKEVVLDSVQVGSSMQQGNANIRKLSNGRLIYKAAPRQTVAGNVPHPIQYNTLRTPRGGQYQVVLPDGSKVWLNAESAIRFPTVFSGSKRTVAISGEAYFEVAKQADKPFIVKADGMNIEVLGTQFNVAAYGESKAIKATLSEGAVRVGRQGDDEKMQYVQLKPGEQASLDRMEGDLQVKPVNLEAALAWKNGLFYFEDTNIKTIMSEISRWYNVNVIYDATSLEDKNFSGVVSRYGKVGALLKRLELTGTVHFRIEGRTIVVTN